MIKVIMFDLDGTLLPMDQNVFTKTYFAGLAKKIEPLGYKPQEVINGVICGVEAMIKNTGLKTNEEIFWDRFCELLGNEIKEHLDIFYDYYRNEFQQVKAVCGFSEQTKEVIKLVKEKGFRVVLATNPLFPKIATESRILWAGLEPEDFEIYTTYEDNKFSKPNLNYYKDLISKLNVLPNECLMVGNDVLEDMIAKELGIKVFLLTDCIINTKEKDISEYNHGSFNELIEYIRSL